MFTEVHNKMLNILNALSKITTSMINCMETIDFNKEVQLRKKIVDHDEEQWESVDDWVN